jgi:hypothetical protein
MAMGRPALQNVTVPAMNRPTKASRAPKNPKEELRPRGSRRDPRADPVTSPPPPLSRPPLSSPPAGRDEPTAPPSGPPVQDRLDDTSVAQIRRIATLEHDILRYERQVEDLEERLADLARERTEHAARVAELERALEKANRGREEIKALRASVDRVGAENAALQEALRRERAAKEELAGRAEELEALVAKIKVLLT